MPQRYAHDAAHVGAMFTVMLIITLIDELTITNTDAVARAIGVMPRATRVKRCYFCARGGAF